MKTSEIHVDENDCAQQLACILIFREICFQVLHTILAFDQRRCQICQPSNLPFSYFVYALEKNLIIFAHNFTS